MNKVLFFLLFSFWIQLSMAAVNPKMQQANEAYQADNFDQAIQEYEQLLAEGYRSEILHYNLGNAYYRKDQLGKAILNFERALLLDPKDKDIRHNLKVARLQLKDEIEVLPDFFLARWWHQTRILMSSNAWSVVGLFFLWLGIAGIVFWLIGNSRTRKKQGFVLGIVLLILSILPFSLAFSRISFQQNTGQAIIIEPEVILHSAPDPGSAEILKLHDGTKVFLIDKIREWHKVNLQNGEQGWLDEKWMEEI